jgi:hypothetical protein
MDQLALCEQDMESMIAEDSTFSTYLLIFQNDNMAKRGLQFFYFCLNESTFKESNTSITKELHKDLKPIFKSIVPVVDTGMSSTHSLMDHDRLQDHNSTIQKIIRMMNIESGT